jgi:ATP-dependent 26S proteasome regulatory subunit
MHLYANKPVPLPKTFTEEHWKKMPSFFTGQNFGRGRFCKRYNTPEKYQHHMKNTYQMATEVDTAIGNIMEVMEEQGVIAENTSKIQTIQTENTSKIQEETTLRSALVTVSKDATDEVLPSPPTMEEKKPQEVETVRVPEEASEESEYLAGSIRRSSQRLAPVTPKGERPSCVPQTRRQEECFGA